MSQIYAGELAKKGAFLRCPPGPSTPGHSLCTEVVSSPVHGLSPGMVLAPPPLGSWTELRRLVRRGSCIRREGSRATTADGLMVWDGAPEACT